ncbi:substrate-binding periplasmic protein [Candidatus Auribacterota bacterium]
MKQAKFILLILLVVLLCSTARAETLRCAIENTPIFPSIMGEGSKIPENNPGTGIETNNELGKRLGIQIVTTRYPWKRCLAMLKAGQADLMWTASYKKKREEYGRYPMINGKVDPLRRFSTKSYALYVRNDSNISYDGKIFHNINGKVGVPRGYSIIEKLKKKGLIIEESPGTKNDFKKLLRGRIEAAAAVTYTADHYISKNDQFKKGIKKIKPLLVTKPYYFMISYQFYEKNPELAEKIWDTLAEIREDKEFQKSLEKYLK